MNPTSRENAEALAVPLGAVPRVLADAVAARRDAVQRDDPARITVSHRTLAWVTTSAGVRRGRSWLARHQRLDRILRSAPLSGVRTAPAGGEFKRPGFNSLIP